MKILVVEDDLLVADALRVTLADLNYAVEVAHDGQAGLDCIEAFDYDLLLLDAILPKLDGVSLCRYVRSRGYMMPILLLTSLDSNHDRAIGLDAGADDYVAKPFDPEELSARIRALLRRGNDRMQPVLACEVTYHQQVLNLTPKEYALLELFLRHSRRLFSCGAILEHLWAYEDAPSEEAVRTHIKGLRHKLKAAGAPTDFVETVYGIGYRLKPNEPHNAQLHSIDASGHRIETISVEAVTAQPHVIAENGTNSSQPDATTDDSLDFLNEIWNRHYDQTNERVATIERAIAALADRSLSAEIRHRAWQDAHTLAGTLGTFGLSHGSQLAKQIESRLDPKTELTPAQMPQLQNELAQLQAAIASKVSTQMATGSPSPTTTIAPPTTTTSPWLLTITKEPALAASLRYAAASKFEFVSTSALVSTQLEQTPDAIVLDLDCFPQIADGLSALSELDRDYPHLPVLVLSKPDSPGERLRQRSIDFEPAPNLIAEEGGRLQQRIEVARRGARLFLSKPIPARQILLAVDRVLQQARARQPRVTIVDDDPLLLEGVSALLSQRGMTVTTLSEPSRFWETLEASAPDLLILDLDMPMHDGIELCRAVRTDPQWATLPILFLTAHSAAIASDRVFAAGADDFVTKPVVDTTLVTRIVNRLERIGIQRSMSPVLPL
jgi:DNA-binding response OmpR family regulator/HPt (histidine-containing phosphotransfer) domain-containing protein